MEVQFKNVNGPYGTGVMADDVTVLCGILHEALMRIPNEFGFPNGRVNFIEELYSHMPRSVTYDDKNGNEVKWLISHENTSVYNMARNILGMIVKTPKDRNKIICALDPGYDAQESSFVVRFDIDEILTHDEIRSKVRGIYLNTEDMWNDVENYDDFYPDNASNGDDERWYNRETRCQHYMYLTEAVGAILESVDQLYYSVSKKKCVKMIVRVLNDIVNRKNTNSVMSRIMAIALSMIEFSIFLDKNGKVRFSSSPSISINSSYMTASYALSIYRLYEDPVLIMTTDLDKDQALTNPKYYTHRSTCTIALKTRSKCFITDPNQARAAWTSMMNSIEGTVFSAFLDEISKKYRRMGGYGDVVGDEVPQFTRDGEQERKVTAEAVTAEATTKAPKSKRGRKKSTPVKPVKDESSDNATLVEADDEADDEPENDD